MWCVIHVFPCLFRLRASDNEGSAIDRAACEEVHLVSVGQPSPKVILRDWTPRKRPRRCGSPGVSTSPVQPAVLTTFQIWTHGEANIRLSFIQSLWIQVELMPASPLAVGLCGHGFSHRSVRFPPSTMLAVFIEVKYSWVQCKAPVK